LLAERIQTRAFSLKSTAQRFHGTWDAVIFTSGEDGLTNSSDEADVMAGRSKELLDSKTRAMCRTIRAERKEAS
jgi:hypothetical protein